MAATNRRASFWNPVGCGMLAAGLGATLAQELGFSTAFAGEGAAALSFGPYDALVDLMQSTPPTSCSRCWSKSSSAATRA